ncbi:MAG: PTS sugar transporter subunit IIA [Alphaproteobacteria bacterium]|nr:PTS sugar transporter subunit IIA [Alphaproteobacteria bacterium]
MNIADIISKDAVLDNVQASNKRELVQILSSKIASLSGLDERVIFDAVWERENLGSTGYGDGVAFPHARIDGLENVSALFARLDEPVDFDSLDNKPVDLVFLLISPENSGADHLTALATLSRVLKTEGSCEKLRKAHSIDEIYATLNA